MVRTWLALIALGFGVVVGDAQTVCIDPGHPSEVGSGTRGRHITEIHAVWLVAQKLAARLQKEGIQTCLTKSSERQFVKNRRRAEIANDAKADLMVRLHCDAGSGNGFAVYFPDRTGVSGKVRGPRPEIIRQSRLAATAFHLALAKHLKLRDNGLKPDTKTAVGSKQGALTGSIFSQVPVLLVEMAVLQNAQDEAYIASPRGQDEMADALTQATLAALKSLRPRTRRGQDEPITPLPY